MSAGNIRCECGLGKMKVRRLRPPGSIRVIAAGPSARTRRGGPGAISMAGADLPPCGLVMGVAGINHCPAAKDDSADVRGVGQGTLSRPAPAPLRGAYVPTLGRTLHACELIGLTPKPSPTRRDPHRSVTLRWWSCRMGFKARAQLSRSGISIRHRCTGWQLAGFVRPKPLVGSGVLPSPRYTVSLNTRLIGRATSRARCVTPCSKGSGKGGRCTELFRSRRRQA